MHDNYERASPITQPARSHNLIGGIGLLSRSWSGRCSGPPPCSTETALGLASRYRPAEAKPDQSCPSPDAPFRVHRTRCTTLDGFCLAFSLWWQVELNLEGVLINYIEFPKLAILIDTLRMYER